MGKTLTLPLKKQWFDLIKSGVKKEEYREIKPHYINRLCATWYNIYAFRFQYFDTLVFTLGYPKADDTERRLTFKNPRIRIGEGRPEWGAEPGKQYFVISWEA